MLLVMITCLVWFSAGLILGITWHRLRQRQEPTRENLNEIINEINMQYANYRRKSQEMLNRQEKRLLLLEKDRNTWRDEVRWAVVKEKKKNADLYSKFGLEDPEI